MKRSKIFAIGGLAVAVAVVLIVKLTGSENVGRTAAGDSPATPRLLDLGADKCVPCKMMKPILDELRTEYSGRLQVDFIDVWKDREAAMQYGIQAIPTQIFYDATGREMSRHTGFMSKQDILREFARRGIKLEGRRSS